MELILSRLVPMKHLIRLAHMAVVLAELCKVVVHTNLAP